MHCYRDGRAYTGYLSDYALLGLALMNISTKPRARPQMAGGALRTLADAMIDRFHDAGWAATTTHAQHDWLIVPVKSFQDRATPSGNGAACQLLALLGNTVSLLGANPDRDYSTLAGETLNAFWKLLEQNPYVGSSLLMGYLMLEGFTMPKPDLHMPVPVEPEEAEQEVPVRVYLVPQPEGLVVVFEIEEGWTSTRLSLRRIECRHRWRSPAICRWRLGRPSGFSRRWSRWAARRSPSTPKRRRVNPRERHQRRGAGRGLPSSAGCLSTLYRAGVRSACYARVPASRKPAGGGVGGYAKGASAQREARPASIRA